MGDIRSLSPSQLLHQAAESNYQMIATQQAAAQQRVQQAQFETPERIALRLFMSRMAGVRGKYELKPNDFLHCHVSKDEVFVFFLLDGKEGVVREQADIFPSDQLVTQFRLITGG